jgi:hypothetical protein
MSLATNAMLLVGLIIAPGDIVSIEGEVLLASLLAVVILAASVRAFMLGVSLGPNGVMIRSFVVSQRIRWPDIVEVGVISERAEPRDASTVGHFPTITYLNQFRFKKSVVLWSLGAAEPALAQQRAATIRELVAVRGGRSGESVAEPS